MTKGNVWKVGTGIELLGLVLLVIIIIPTAFTWIAAEIEDAAEEEVAAYEQRVLIDELNYKVEQLQINTTN